MNIFDIFAAAKFEYAVIFEFSCDSTTHHQLLLSSLHPLPYHCCTASVAVIVAAVVWGVIIVILFVVIFSCSWVLLHNRSKGLLSAAVVGKIGAIPNMGGGKLLIGIVVVIIAFIVVLQLLLPLLWLSCGGHHFITLCMGVIALGK